MCVVLWCVVYIEGGVFDFNGLVFSVDFFEVFSNFIFNFLGRVVLVIFCLWYFMGKVVWRFDGGKGSLISYYMFIVILFYFWVIGMVLELVVEGLSYLVWVILFVFFVYGIVICIGICEKFGINGNMVEDFFVVMFFYLFVVYQMDYFMENFFFLFLYGVYNVDVYGNGKGVVYENKGVDDVFFEKVDIVF